MTDEPEHDPPTPAIMQYEVVNGNEFPIPDFFDGVPLLFPPNETVTVSPQVALHCFGYPGEDRDRAVHMARRYGWASKEMLSMTAGPGRTEPQYVALAANVKITPIYYDLVRRDPNAPIPADPGEEGDEGPMPAPPEDTTKAGKRKRTPGRISAKSAPRGRKRGQERELADTRAGRGRR